MYCRSLVDNHGVMPELSPALSFGLFPVFKLALQRLLKHMQLLVEVGELLPFP